MRCMEAERWISMRVDGEPIPGGIEPGLDAHLSSCDSCRRNFRVESERARLLESAMAAPKGEDSGIVASTIVRAAFTPETGGKFPGAMVWLPPGSIFGLAPLALAFAALIVVAGGLWMVLAPGLPPALGPKAATAAGYVLEQDIQDTDVVASPKDGVPMGRDISKKHWIYVIPAKEGPSARLTLDVERVDTRYVHLVNWDYR